MRWHGNNIQWYKSKGYVYTGYGDFFDVKVEDLPPNSDIEVEAVCDYCGKIKKVAYVDYNKNIKTLNKYACKECAGKKNSEKHEQTKKAFKFHKPCNSTNFKGVIYEINEYNLKGLNNEQLILINEIQRFCEENGHFPSEKEMSNKNGYISRTQYYKYFNANKFTDVYKYIYPLQKGTRNKEITIIQKHKNKPSKIKCIKCKKEKDFNEDNFPKHKNSKYGLKSICKECVTYYSFLSNYRKKGIVFEKFEDIDSIQWWEYYYEGIIGLMPEFCSKEENIIKIIRHVVLNVIKLNREQICDEKYFNKEVMKKYKIWHLYTKIYDKYKVIQLCFPEMNIKPYELSRTRYNEENIIEFIDCWIKQNNYSIFDLLECKFSSREENKKMNSLVWTKFSSYIDMLVWYFKKKNILHPIYNREIYHCDFSHKPNGYWHIEENRIKAIRTYCMDNGILEVLNNTEKLKKWIYQHFTQNKVAKIFNYTDYYHSLYDVLVNAFPLIQQNKILFKWEWHQWNKYDREFLLQMLRELVLYRFKIDDLKDIPKYLNYANMENNGYKKFNKHILRKRFKNYYEWACEAFPEYKHLWKKEDFGIFIAFDGSICDSYEELQIYEFIKKELNLNIEAIGSRHYDNEHVFSPNNKKDKWYIPDFFIKDKNVYIEYFGMYTDNPPKDNKVLMAYYNKTHRKIKFYNQIKEFKFIYLFPDDLKNDFHGVREKLSFIM